MKTVTVHLNSIDKVKSFMRAINEYDNDFDLVSGHYSVDAKSIMGVFALDLSRPVQLNIHSRSHGDQIAQALDAYIC